MSTDTGKIWLLTMAILSFLCTVALFLAGLGYGSVDKRLCRMEAWNAWAAESLHVLAFYQDERLLKENKPIPARPKLNYMP